MKKIIRAVRIPTTHAPRDESIRVTDLCDAVEPAADAVVSSDSMYLLGEGQ